MVTRCPKCSTDNTERGSCSNCGHEFIEGGKEHDDHWADKKKRQDSNVIICIVIVVGGVSLAAMMGSVIPFIIAVVLAGVIFQRDQ